MGVSSKFAECALVAWPWSGALPGEGPVMEEPPLCCLCLSWCCEADCCGVDCWCCLEMVPDVDEDDAEEA